MDSRVASVCWLQVDPASHLRDTLFKTMHSRCGSKDPLLAIEPGECFAALRVCPMFLYA